MPVKKGTNVSHNSSGGTWISNKGNSITKETSIRYEKEISNEVLDNVRTGSALKLDPEHAFNDIIDNYVGYATKFELKGGDDVKKTLYQLEGSFKIGVINV